MADSAAFTFRSSLHGFNREDVVSFIESTTLENEKEKRLLQDANARLQSGLDEATAELDSARAASEALKAASDECETLSQENRQLTAALEQLKAELAQLNTELDAAKRAPENAQRAAAPTPGVGLNAPIPPISEFMPVQPTVSSKNYSELELAAYRRAEVTERLARERAEKIYEQVSAVFAGAAGRFKDSEGDLDALSKTMQLNIDQLQQILYAIRCAYTETEDSLKAVGEKNREYAAAEV